MILVALALFAQILNPNANYQGYILADPIDPYSFTLAVPDGRYRVQAAANCDGFVIPQDVTVWPEAQLPPWLTITQPGQPLPGCLLKVTGRMSDTGCFTDDTGTCESSMEAPADDE